jgi:hypothetical protein
VTRAEVENITAHWAEDFASEGAVPLIGIGVPPNGKVCTVCTEIDKAEAARILRRVLGLIEAEGN